jgi:hypothetical protein
MQIGITCALSGLRVNETLWAKRSDDRQRAVLLKHNDDEIREHRKAAPIVTTARGDGYYGTSESEPRSCTTRGIMVSAALRR